jgi:hypothetical protein
MTALINQLEIIILKDRTKIFILKTNTKFGPMTLIY